MTTAPGSSVSLSFEDSEYTRSTKRVRREEEHEDSRASSEDEDDQGCCCTNDGCPWQWGSTSSTSSTSNTSNKSARSMASSAVSELSFFHGPLFSVKEYRNKRTGEVRLSVFQGDGRMSVAQILFSFAPGTDCGYGHVKCVRVNQGFRGMGLGPLLFKEVFATLRSLSVPEVRLEAEEDMSKHNRLVKYYEALGFRQLQGSKVQYLYDNDRIFRKIPMCRKVPAAHPRLRRFQRLADNSSFLIVRLQAKTGCFVRSTADGNVVSPAAATSDSGLTASSTPSVAEAAVEGYDNSGGGAASGGSMGGGGGAAGLPGVGEGGGGGDAVAGRSSKEGKGEKKDARRRNADDHWILMMHEIRGIVCFESAYGKYLCVEPDGKVVADRSWDSSWEQFRLERFTYPGTQTNNPSADHGDGTSGRSWKKTVRSKQEANSGVVKAKDRFALRTYHGQYLSVDADCGTVSASAQPVLWTTDERNAICQCEGVVSWAAPTPASRRQMAHQAHLRNMRQIQNVSFVKGVLNKYLNSFGARGRFSVKEVLDQLDHHRDLLQPEGQSRVSLAGLMVLTAEDIMDEGLPDWMQAIGLVHGLGRILHFLGVEAGVTPTERECVLGEYSWVVGAPFPSSIACPSYNAGNNDAFDERFGAGGINPTGMYNPASGLDNALLCFTGPEYMYLVLRNSRSCIPPQGLSMLRYYPLEPWHAGDGYSVLESPADKELKESVRQFDAIRRATLHSLTVQRREVNLQRSWDDHLGDLVEKFFPGKLAW